DTVDELETHRHEAEQQQGDAKQTDERARSSFANDNAMIRKHAAAFGAAVAGQADQGISAGSAMWFGADALGSEAAFDQYDAQHHPTQAKQLEEKNRMPGRLHGGTVTLIVSEQDTVGLARACVSV